VTWAQYYKTIFLAYFLDFPIQKTAEKLTKFEEITDKFSDQNILGKHILGNPKNLNENITNLLENSTNL
jgi:hypothetical protein